VRIALLCPGPSLARTFPACAGGYDLVLAAADRDCPPVSELLAVLGSPQFRAVVGQIGGYDTSRTGEERRL